MLIFIIRVFDCASIPQDDHLVGDEFSPKMALALIVFPAASLETAFDIDLLIFLEVRFADFGEVAPGDNVEPLVFFAAFALGADPASTGNNAEARDRTATRCVAHLRVTSQI